MARSIRIDLLYFAVVKDLLGCDREQLTIEDESTVADLRRVLEARHPNLVGTWGHVRLARNEAFARDADRILDGDTIALIPPVAGG